MRTTLKLALALCLATLATPGIADHPAPPVPAGGINFAIEGKCEDHETGEKGYCYAGYGTDGTFYATFWQDDVMKFIRQIKPGFTDYETVWVAHGYATY